MKLIWIPPGEFLMGSPSEQGGMSSEGPVHKVTISNGFWMGVYEVTQEQYKTVMGENPSHFKGDNLPVEQVSWDNAVEFCRKLSEKEGRIYRLPTEAEWENACRAGTTTRFSWGDDQLTGLCNAENCTEKLESGRKYDRNVELFRRRGLPVDSTVPVGSFKPNAFGLYDMHGNVCEWCSDFYDREYYKNKWYVIDPQGPNISSYPRPTYVIRGGSWRWHLFECRSANRDFNGNSATLNYIGFRVALESDSIEDTPY